MAKARYHELRRSRTIDQERRALKLRLAGQSHEDIGRALGVTRSRATQILGSALAKRRQERDDAADALLDLELAKLDQIEREIAPLIVGQVRAIRKEWAEYGAKVEEWESACEAAKAAGTDPPKMPKLRQSWTLNDVLLAVDRKLKVVERRAKLLGLDDPKPIDPDDTGLDPETAGRLMAAFAREAGARADGPDDAIPAAPQQSDAVVADAESLV